ncbi:hypothetical protein HG530_012206 [Fusarium avenaceum]|nr:hypothetical protein HG530_012206 [Fusarium avenaceum]
MLVCNALHILVTTTTHTDDDIFVLLHCLGKLDGAIDTMSSLKGGDDTLELTHELEAKESLGISRGNELGSFVILPRAQLRADTRDTLGTTCESSAMSRGINTIATGLNTQKLNTGVILERVEHANGVAATTYTSNDGIWELSSLLEHLLLGLGTDDGLECSDDGGEGVRSDSRTDDVVGSVKVNDPGTKGFVDSISESLATSLDSNNLGTQQAHTENVEGLSSDTVLSSTSFSNNTLLSESSSEEKLAQCVVDLVAAGMVQVLTLEPDVSTTSMLGAVLLDIGKSLARLGVLNGSDDLAANDDTI